MNESDDLTRVREVLASAGFRTVVCDLGALSRVEDEAPTAMRDCVDAALPGYVWTDSWGKRNVLLYEPTPEELAQVKARVR